MMFHLDVGEDPEHVLPGGGHGRPVVYPDPVLLRQTDAGPRVPDVVEAHPVPGQNGGGALHPLAATLPVLVEGQVAAIGAQFIS